MSVLHNSSDSMQMSDDIRYTPRWLRFGASWGWRLLVLAAVVVVIWKSGSAMSQIVVPVIIAILLTAGMSPWCEWLVSKKWPRWAAALLAVIVLILVVLGLLVVVGAQIAWQSSQLADAATQGFTAALGWLAEGPLRIDADQVNQWKDLVVSKAEKSAAAIAGGVVSVGSRVGAFFAGLATCLFATFFFLKDSNRITATVRSLIPSNALKSMNPSIRGGWVSLTAYVRAAVIVAAIDGVGAGIGALILGSNLWLAITAFTFVCSFVPLLGALVAGTVATLVILVTLGLPKAVIMLVVFVLVMWIESHLLQPLVLGKAVEIHPLIVLLGISAGAILAGITGALFAIPVVAFATGCIRTNEVAEEEDEPDSSRAEIGVREKSDHPERKNQTETELEL